MSASSIFNSIVQLLILTGQRRSEISAMTGLDRLGQPNDYVPADHQE